MMATEYFEESGEEGEELEVLAPESHSYFHGISII